MPNELQIEGVAVSPPKSVPSIEGKGGEEQWIDLKIDIKNVSNSSQHVITSLRFLKYDSDSYTLHVGMFQPAPQQEFLQRYLAPSTAEIPPDGTYTVNVSVPVNMKQMKFSHEAGLQIQQQDIQNAKQITVTIAYDATPPPRDPTAPAHEVRQRVADWGQRTEATIQR